MIVLDTTHTLKIVLEETATTQLHFYASYIDTANDEVGSNEGTTNDTTDVTLVSSPSSGKRLIRFINIYNADDSSHNVVVKIDDGTNQRVLKRVTLTSKDSLVYTPSKGWVIESLRKFIQLDDTPNSYSGLAGKLFKVNSSETALEPSTNTDSEIADAVDKRHTQNTDHIIKDADGDTFLDVEESADKDEIVGKVAGVEALRIYSSGILSLQKQSACKVYMDNGGSNYNVSANTTTKVPLDTVIFDRHSEFDTTNHRFTATKSGIYLILAIVTTSGVADGYWVSAAIAKNGGGYAYTYIHSNGSGYLGIVVTTLVELSAGDYIELNVRSEDDFSVVYGSQHTYLSIVKVA